MTEAEELEYIEDEIKLLGDKIDQHRERALAILKGRTAHVRGRPFKITNARVFFGSACRLYFSGPVLKKDGQPHARQTETSSFSTMDRIDL